MARGLEGSVALVTGASRGIGRGIALQLGEAGATVYVTGRTPKESDSKDGLTDLPTLEKTANEVTERGGKGIAYYCDHSKSDQVEALFERINSEQNGQLDILVNNAFAAVNALTDSWGKKFWELDVSMWDIVNNVGLKNHYICCVHAARMMVPRKKGLIVTVSSPAGVQYLFNVAYGVGKAACDRLAADTAVELQDFNVASVSLWPGIVRTELGTKKIEETELDQLTVGNLKGEQVRDMFKKHSESVEFSGKCVVALAKDQKIMNKSGKVLISGDLACQYRLKDVDGSDVMSMRSVKAILASTGRTSLASWTPKWIKLPGWAIAAGTSKM